MLFQFQGLMHIPKVVFSQGTPRLQMRHVRATFVELIKVCSFCSLSFSNRVCWLLTRLVWVTCVGLTVFNLIWSQCLFPWLQLWIADAGRILDWSLQKINAVAMRFSDVEVCMHSSSDFWPAVLGRFPNVKLKSCFLTQFDNTFVSFSGTTWFDNTFVSFSGTTWWLEWKSWTVRWIKRSRCSSSGFLSPLADSRRFLPDTVIPVAIILSTDRWVCYYQITPLPIIVVCIREFENFLLFLPYSPFYR